MTDLEKLREIYDSLPRIECKRLCQESCGPIMYADAERVAIVNAHGMLPGTTPDFTCTCLSKEGGCMIYDNRPLICRIWGLVRAMQCPHGCIPERWLNDNQAGELLEKVRTLGGNGDLHSTISPALVEILIRKHKP